MVDYDLQCGEFAPGFEPTTPPKIVVPDAGVVLPPVSWTPLPIIQPPTEPPNNPPVPPIPQPPTTQTLPGFGTNGTVFNPAPGVPTNPPTYTPNPGFVINPGLNNNPFGFVTNTVAQTTPPGLFSLPGLQVTPGLNSQSLAVQNNSNLYYKEGENNLYLNGENGASLLPEVLKIGSRNILSRSFLLDKAKDTLGIVNSRIYFDPSSNVIRQQNISAYRRTPNTEYLEVFKTLVDKNVVKIFSELKTGYYNWTSITDLTLDKLSLSLRPDIKKILDSQFDSIGNKIPYGTFVEGIMSLLERGDIETLNGQTFFNLNNLKNSDSSDKKLLRTIRPSLPEIVAYVVNNKIPVDYNKYENLVQRNFMKTWWVKPTELFEGIPIITSAGTEYVDISNYYDTSVLYGTSSLVLSSAEDHFIYVNDSKVDTFINLSSTGVLSNYDRKLVLSWLEEEDLVGLEVSGTSSIEFEYDVSSPIDSFYLFQLNLSSITNYTTKHLVNNLRAKYTKVSTYSSIDEFIRRKAAPWLILYVSNHDPVIGYFDSDEASYHFSFKDITLNEVGADKGIESLASNLPSFVVVIPTDKFENNPYFTLSQLVDEYNILQPTSGTFLIDTDTPKLSRRILYFGRTPNKTNTEIGLTTPLKPYFYGYRGENQFGEDVNTQSVNFIFNENHPLFSSSVNYNLEHSVRNKDPLRAYLEIASSIKLNCTISPSGLYYKDIISRLTSQEYYGLLKANPNLISNINRKLLNINVRNRKLTDSLTSGILSGSVGTEYANG